MSNAIGYAQQELDTTLKCSKKFSEVELAQMLAGECSLAGESSDPVAAFLVCIIVQFSFVA